jgi:RimJ/RimL family protein N-acetyltransferase
MLKDAEVSRLHRIKSDELWHFYDGSSLTIHMIAPDGSYQQATLGRDAHRGEALQVLVPGGTWFGATVDDPESYSLVGCTVAPGFDYRDLELGDPKSLLERYPQHRHIIDLLTARAVRAMPDAVEGETAGVLTDGRVTIRPYRANDVPALFEAVRESIPDLSQWARWCHPEYAVEETWSWVRHSIDAWIRGIEYNFVVADARQPSVLGGCGLNRILREDGVANLGYWIRSSATGRGVATAAARLAAHFGFEHLHLNRIEILVSVRNQPSQRVAEKTGAQIEGILRRRFVVHGEVHDAACYSLAPSDLTTG